jgi:hypothetical protein
MPAEGRLFALRAARERDGSCIGDDAGRGERSLLRADCGAEKASGEASKEASGEEKQVTTENESQANANQIIPLVHDPSLPFLPLAIEDLRDFSAEIRIAFTPIVRRDYGFNPGIYRVLYTIRRPQLIESCGSMRFAYDPGKCGDLVREVAAKAPSGVQLNFTLPCKFECEIGNMKASCFATASGVIGRIESLESEIAGGGLVLAKIGFHVRLPFHAKCRHTGLEFTVHDQANAEIGPLTEVVA